MFYNHSTDGEIFKQRLDIFFMIILLYNFTGTTSYKYYGTIGIW